MNPFFSIVIPVYNVKKYIKSCYISVINQTYGDYEVILVDDGSTDSSGRMCDDFSIKKSNVNVIHKKNGGLSDARNVGINAAKGKYIVLLDSDDMLEKDALNSLSNLIRKKDYPDVIINRIKSFSDNYIGMEECNYRFQDELEYMPIAEAFEDILKKDDYLPTAWTIVIKRHYLIQNDLFFVKGILHEDEEWTPRAVLKSNKATFNNEILYLYRKNREGSITQTKNIKRDLDKIWIAESLFNESKNGEYNITSSKMLLERAANIYWGVLLNCYRYKKNKVDYDSIIKDLKTRMYIFKLSTNKKYLACSLFSNVFGINNTVFFLNKLVSIKSKKIGYQKLKNE